MQTYFAEILSFVVANFSMKSHWKVMKDFSWGFKVKNSQPFLKIRDSKIWSSEFSEVSKGKFEIAKFEAADYCDMNDWTSVHVCK